MKDTIYTRKAHAEVNSCLPDLRRSGEMHRVSAQSTDRLSSLRFTDIFSGGSRIFPGEGVNSQSECAKLLFCNFLPKTA